MPLFVKRLTLALPFFAACSFTAHASSINAIYAFGDSLSDAGNAAILTAGAEPAAPYVNGEFSNGPVWVQDLAKSLNLGPLTASLAGGTDYAVGGAISGTLPIQAAGPTDLPAQIAAFSLAHPAANPNGLYTIWIGSNDLSDILASSPTPAQAAADAAAVAANIDSAINTLAGDGAKNFLVLTVPDLGKTPGAIATGPLGVAAASGLSAEFDNLLVNGSGPIPSLNKLAGIDGINLNVLDTYSLIDGIVAKPASFGLTDVTDPCLTGEVNYAGGTPCANPNQYLFWDELHPTAAGHEILAADAYQIVAPEPATFALLGVGALAVFAARRRARLLN
jgi:phospholipase/lecithinase/hemolysin